MIKKSVLMIVTPILLAIFGLFAQHFLTQYLTQTQYGQFQLMLSWVAVLSFFSLNSFNTIVTKSAAQKYPVFFVLASKICFVGSLIGSTVLLIVGFFFQTNLTSLFILLAIFFPFYSGINLAPSFYIGAAKFKEYSILVITTQMLVSIFQILLVYFFKDVKIVLFCTLFITSIVNFGITFHLLSAVKQELNSEKTKEFTRYGFHLTLINIIPTVASKIQYIVLAALTNPVSVAIYAVAQIIPEKIKAIFKSSLNPFSIYLASNEKSKSIKIVRNSIPLLFFLGLITTLLTATILPIMIRFIFGQKYYESIVYSVILLTVLIFVPLNGVLTSIIIYHGYKTFYAKLTTLISVMRIIFFIIFIPFFKIYGIMLAVILVALCTTIINLFWFYRLPRTNMKKSVLILTSTFRSQNYEQIVIKPEITGENILNVVETDYLLKDGTYPLWIKIIAKLSFTKYI